MKKADIGVGIGLLILSAWVFWQAFSYRQTVIYIYGPNLFPQLIALITAVCAVFLIFRALQGKALALKEHIDRRGFLRMVCAIVMCICYLLIMQVIGFALSTWVFLFVLMLFLGQKGWITRTVSSAAVSLIVWAIFRYFLVIPIPSGMFRFTF